jgi:protein arginine kinase
MENENNILFDCRVPSWMEQPGPEGDIVLSSRIRLARNLIGAPFPEQADVGQLEQIGHQASFTVGDLADADHSHQFEMLEMSSLTEQERRILVEKHLTSLKHIQCPTNRLLIIRDDTAVSIMVNEEDHFRIQSLTAGLNLKAAWRMADETDNLLESRLGFAFSEELGYLTSCPTNLGTGLRASVMMHLPALVLLGQMHRIIEVSTQLGMAVRGFYGEGTDAYGNVFQVSNQQTLGFNEQEIVSNVLGLARQLVEQERAARRLLLTDSMEELADRIWRAYGTLRYARSISGQEALGLLSAMRLGIDLGIISHLSSKIFTELIIGSRSCVVSRMAHVEKMDKAERNRLRAQIIRDRIKGGENDV